MPWLQLRNRSIVTDLPALTDLASARVLIERLAAGLREAAIADFRRPPPEPTSCCGRGCNGCVWEGYFAAVGWWRDDAIELLSGLKNTGAC